MTPFIRKPIVIRNSFLTCNGYILRTRGYSVEFRQIGMPGIRKFLLLKVPRLKYGKRGCMYSVWARLWWVLAWSGEMQPYRVTVLATIFSAPSQQWNYDHSGPEIRSGRTHCGREMASLTLQEPTGEYSCVMYSLIENTLVSNYTHLQSLSNQSSAYS